ncbi:uncharacterized protein LOC109544353 [Dendroctonus ponderosae]|uniref:uncharacterized protein LOC109544353 n=1 Tax=Dendroctonus ponderosae TaxID=77166 RepID=UPI002035E482|nr:uncharacterized protein LOC109544353 [Dendroctonus ponderosae]
MIKTIKFRKNNEYLGCRYFKLLISVHVPTEDKDEVTKGLVYYTLERKPAQLLKQDMTLTLVDFNKKIEQEKTFRPHVGIQPAQSFGRNGLRVPDLAASTNMLIKSTIFEHKDKHNNTWRYNYGVTRNQIDHVKVNARQVRYVLDLRSYKEVDANSDYFLIKAKIKARIAIVNNTRTTRLSAQWDIEKLHQTQYQGELERLIRQNTKTSYNTDMETY